MESVNQESRLTITPILYGSVFYVAFPGGSVVKNLLARPGGTGDSGLILEWGRSPTGGNGNPLQYCCLENSMDGGVWLAAVHEVSQSKTQLSD